MRTTRRRLCWTFIGIRWLRFAVSSTDLLDRVPYGVGQLLVDAISLRVVFEEDDLAIDEANLIEVNHGVSDDCEISVFDRFHVRSCLSDDGCGIIRGMGAKETPSGRISSKPTAVGAIVQAGLRRVHQWFPFLSSGPNAVKIHCLGRSDFAGSFVNVRTAV